MVPDDLKVITDGAGDVAALHHGNIYVKHLKIDDWNWVDSALQ